MHLSRLHIEGLRNIDAAELSLGSGFNYLYGANGAGKTAVLEAIHLLARGRSFRAKSLDRLVNVGSKRLVVRAGVVNRSGTHRLALSRADGASNFRLDGLNVGGFSGLIEQLAVQTLLPDASNLIYSGPGERRGFLDWGLFHVEHGFLALSRQYNRALRQRNAWLKSEAGVGAKSNQGSRPSLETDPWLTPLVGYASQLNDARGRYVDSLRPPFAQALLALSHNLQVELAYDSGGLGAAEDSYKKMSESFARDVKFGVTHRGPHRADLTILTPSHHTKNLPTVATPGNKAAEVFSRGQAKIAASALMLAQVDLQQSATGQGSVVLIDDFGAELDSEHWKRFVSTLEKLACQVIVTSTQAPEVQGLLSEVDCKVFHVEHGRICSI